MVRVPQGLTLAEDGLAVFRLTRLVVDDTLLDAPRDAVLEVLDGGGPLARKVGEGLRCYWCVSVWVGAGAALASLAAPRAWRVVARAAAASAIAGLLDGGGLSSRT